MNRSLLSRITRVFVALWTVALLSDASQLHSCPMHDGTIPADAGRLGISDAPPAHQHDAPPADNGSHHGHACTCLGACTTGITTTLSPPPVSIVPVPEQLVAVEPEHVDTALVPARPPSLRLPFANGPPRAHGARDASPVRG